MREKHGPASPSKIQTSFPFYQSTAGQGGENKHCLLGLDGCIELSKFPNVLLVNKDVDVRVQLSVAAKQLVLKLWILTNQIANKLDNRLALQFKSTVLANQHS